MHPLTWHYSGPNRSSDPRNVMSVVFNDVRNVPDSDVAEMRRPDFIVEDVGKGVW